MNDIAKNIKKIRNAKGISQEALAQELHVTRQAVSNWENSKTQPDLATLENISAFFGIELTELLYGPKPANAFTAAKPRRIRNTIILAVITVVLFAAQWALLGYGRAFIQRYYSMSWLLAGYFFQYLFFLCATFAVLSLAYIWHDIALKKRLLRIILLIIGIILAAITPITIISSITEYQYKISAFITIFYYLLLYESLPLLHVATGACLFFGIHRNQ